MALPGVQPITEREDSVMNNPSTVEQLREMRFSAMATEFEAQIQDPTTYAQVSIWLL